MANFYVVIGAERVNLKLDDSDKHRPQSKQLFVFVGECDKTRQDNALFGVLYSPMYIDFLSKVCVCVSVGGWGCSFSLRVRSDLAPPPPPPSPLLLLDLPLSLEYYLLT